MSNASKARKAQALADLAKVTTLDASVPVLNDVVNADVVISQMVDALAQPALNVFGMTDAQMTDAINIAPVMPASAQVIAGKRAQNKSAKAWLIELLSVADASYTLKQLVALTGKTEVNVRTMLSDLRSATYAGKYGVFKTVSTRTNNVLTYSKAPS